MRRKDVGRGAEGEEVERWGTVMRQLRELLLLLLLLLLELLRLSREGVLNGEVVV
jgi:hypothetical protein